MHTFVFPILTHKTELRPHAWSRAEHQRRDTGSVAGVEPMVAVFCKIEPDGLLKLHRP
jgi:hypothetical protein